MYKNQSCLRFEGNNLVLCPKSKAKIEEEVLYRKSSLYLFVNLFCCPTLKDQKFVLRLFSLLSSLFSNNLGLVLCIFLNVCFKVQSFYYLLYNSLSNTCFCKLSSDLHFYNEAIEAFLLLFLVRSMLARGILLFDYFNAVYSMCFDLSLDFLRTSLILFFAILQ